jgi:dihydropteroate synthase
MKPAELGQSVPSDLEALAARRSKLADALRATSAPQIMGIINATDDSFFEGSRVNSSEAVERALAMWDAGATWVDIGGESTRPGAEPVPLEVELARVVPVIETLRNQRPTALISVDTRHPEVAKQALLAGADMVNDVSGLRNPAMVDLVVAEGCAVCIMHMQGEPGTMQNEPDYEDCVSEVSTTLEGVRQRLMERGHPAELIVLDPGIGFGKTQAHNLELLNAGKTIASSGKTPVLWGVSRKSIVGHLTGRQRAEDRLSGTLALAAVAQRLGIDILRVHDVEAHIDLFNALEPFTTAQRHPPE